MRAFLKAFGQATGLPVVFAGPIGSDQAAWHEIGCALDAELRRESAGQRLRTKFHQLLLEAAGEHPAMRTCASGLSAGAVPLQTGGQTVGFLVTGGFFSAPMGPPQLNRARHLLAREGVTIEPGVLEALSRTVPVVPPERQEALLHLMQLAAEHLMARLTERIAAPESHTPALVDQVCRIVHTEFARPVSVEGIAQRLKVSEGHLSRTFHHATGLRIVEYVARFRAERARALLVETGRPIVELAAECGFQSVSQFNRVFRAQFGEKPRDVRMRGRG